MRVLIAAMMLALTFGAASAATKDINAGPIWDNLDAQGKCPGVCSAAGGDWDGNWHTTVPGTQSVCSCDIGGGSGKKKAKNFNAGPIWNNADAGTKCPAVCISHDRKWTGNWHTTQEGQMSQCECSR